MKAPEKLYILFNHPHTVDYTKLNKRRDDEEVEYIRTDAFIKKAKKWFEKHPELYDANGIRCYSIEDFEDFKNYMKGE